MIFARLNRSKIFCYLCFLIPFVEPYIRLYVSEDEIIFKKKFPDEVDTSDACEFRIWWDDINNGLNQLGYWLFDEG